MRRDPVESTPEYKRIEAELERKIKEAIGGGGYLGYCHLYWATKKRILRQDYGIEWKSPAQLNPGVRFD